MAEESTNQRVTLAILGEKIDHMNVKLDDIIELYRKDHDILLGHDGAIAANARSLERCEKRIEKVDSARKTEGRLTGIVTAVLATIGFVWPKQ